MLKGEFSGQADEVMLVDIPADELLVRLKAGKVYLPQQAERAVNNFFRRGNLMALSELAVLCYYLRGSCCAACRLYDVANHSTHRGSMNESNLTRRTLLAAAAAIPLASAAASAAASEKIRSAHPKDINMTSRPFTKTVAPDWLLAFWREIDDKTWGNGFDCFKEDAIANLGVSDWHGREAIRENLRVFIDKGFTAHHEVVEYWDGGSLKVFRGFVTMKPNDPTQKTVRPAMTHFFYMDEKDPSKVAHWYGSVGPVAF